MSLGTKKVTVAILRSCAVPAGRAPVRVHDREGKSEVDKPAKERRQYVGTVLMVMQVLTPQAIYIHM